MLPVAELGPVEIRHNRYFVPLDKIVQKSYKEDYDLKQEIGSGAYGICRIVKSLRKPKFFVAKEIKSWKYDNDDDRKFLFNEILLQSNLKHKNIVFLDKVYVEDGKFTLITELCCYGCLDTLINEVKELLGEGERRHMIHGMLCGTRYLHQRDIVHGDIKPQNIFVAEGLTLKIGDFGMAHYEDQVDYFGGTLNYFAPEIFKHSEERHTTKTDVWAIGCSSYYIYTGEELFTHNTGDRPAQIRRSIKQNRRHESWYELPIEVRNFLSLMTNKDPWKRPECSKLIRHPFLMRKIKRQLSGSVLSELSSCIFEPYSPSKTSSFRT